jgi:hypothetical protein
MHCAHCVFHVCFVDDALALGAKKKFVELVKSCPVGMNGISTKAYLNILPLG